MVYHLMVLTCLICAPGCQTKPSPGPGALSDPSPDPLPDPIPAALPDPNPDPIPLPSPNALASPGKLKAMKLFLFFDYFSFLSSSETNGLCVCVLCASNFTKKQNSALVKKKQMLY